MYIKCWGCRGSVPVSGKDYLFYGGDTTCLEIRDLKDNLIIVDGGTGIRELGQKILKEKKQIIHLIFTHVHLDHIIGLPFFAPFYSKDYKIIVYGDPSVQGNTLDLAFKLFSDPFFPIKYHELSAKLTFNPINSSFKIGDIEIETIPLSHPDRGIGFKFIEKNKKFVFLTDNELGFVHEGGKEFEEYAEFCKGSDLLIHDAEYTKEEYEQKIRWGHSSIDDAVLLAIKSKVKMVGFFHHNQNHSDEQIKDMELYAKTRLRGIEGFMVYKTQEILL